MRKVLTVLVRSSWSLFLVVALLLLTASECDPDDPTADPGGTHLEIPPEDPWGFVDDMAAQGEWEGLARAAEGAIDNPDRPISRDAALAVYAAALAHIDTEEAASDLSGIRGEVEALDAEQLEEEALPWLDEARDAVATLLPGRLAPEAP